MHFDRETRDGMRRLIGDGGGAMHGTVVLALLDDLDELELQHPRSVRPTEPADVPRSSQGGPDVAWQVEVPLEDIGKLHRLIEELTVPQQDVVLGGVVVFSYWYAGRIPEGAFQIACFVDPAFSGREAEAVGLVRAFLEDWSRSPDVQVLTLPPRRTYDDA